MEPEPRFGGARIVSVRTGIDDPVFYPAAPASDLTLDYDPPS